MLLSKRVVGEVKNGVELDSIQQQCCIHTKSSRNNQDKRSHLSLFPTSKSEVLKKAKNSS